MINNEINIRKAQNKDIDQIIILLNEVLELHAKIRPDIFISGTTKYTKEELFKIINDDNTPVFVATTCEKVIGYVFCIFKKQPFTTNMHDFKTLFIDDLCVDKTFRSMHIGKQLFDYVLNYAKENKCYDVTLNVWEGNDTAYAFYKKMGMFVKETQMEIIVDKKNHK